MITAQHDSLQAIRDSVSMHPASSPLSKDVPDKHKLVTETKMRLNQGTLHWNNEEGNTHRNSTNGEEAVTNALLISPIIDIERQPERKQVLD